MHPNFSRHDLPCLLNIPEVAVAVCLRNLINSSHPTSPDSALWQPTFLDRAEKQHLNNKICTVKIATTKCMKQSKCSLLLGVFPQNLQNLILLTILTSLVIWLPNPLPIRKQQIGQGSGLLVPVQR